MAESLGSMGKFCSQRSEQDGGPWEGFTHCFVGLQLQSVRSKTTPTADGIQTPREKSSGTTIFERDIERKH